jgi:hypothetical protein
VREVLSLSRLCKLALARSTINNAVLKTKGISAQDLHHLTQLRQTAERARQKHNLIRILTVTRLVPPVDGGAIPSIRFFDEAADWLLKMRLADPTTGYVPDTERKNVAKFLNRMLGLSVDAQNRLLNAYAALLAAIRGYEKVKGGAEDGPSTLCAERIRHRNGPAGEPVHSDAGSGAASVLYELECDTGISWANAQRQYEQLQEKDELNQMLLSSTKPAKGSAAKRTALHAGFYKQRRSGNIALAVPIGSVSAIGQAKTKRTAARAFKLTRPWRLAQRQGKQQAQDGSAKPRSRAQAAHVHANELQVGASGH